MVEPDRARFSLLDATAAYCPRVVVRSAPGMVQEVFRRVLSHRRNRRAVLYLGAAAMAAHRRRTFDFSPARHRRDRKLLLLQSAHDRALFVALRRHALSSREMPSAGQTVGDIHTRHRGSRRHAADKRDAYFFGVQTER